MTSKGLRSGRERSRASRRSVLAAAVIQQDVTDSGDEAQPSPELSESVGNIPVPPPLPGVSTPPQPPTIGGANTVQGAQAVQGVRPASLSPGDPPQGLPVCEALVRG